MARVNRIASNKPKLDMVLLCIPSQFGLVKYGCWELSGLVWFYINWFGIDEFSLVWLSLVWFHEVDFLKCSRSASQLSFTNLFKYSS